MAQWSELREISRLFLRLGFTAFGGPVAHIAMMHDEVVKKRHWLTEQEFLDILGATNLIPGPNSTEMAIHLSFKRAGWWGLLMGGLSFTAPAVGLMLLCAIAYQQFGTTPQGTWLLYGVKPVAIAIIAQALWKLGKKAIKDRFGIGLAVFNVVLSLVGLHELWLLFLSGFIGLGKKLGGQWLKTKQTRSIVPAPFLLLLNGTPANFSLGWLFLMFLKVGAVLYGSGYVLVAFLRADFVERLGWLTDQQLLDAIAIGQITPGPLSSTATFIGYLLGGVPGAGVATLGMFLPSFLFVAILNPILPKLLQAKSFRAFLDGVNIGALSLMTVVTVFLAQSSLVDPLTIGVAIAALFLLTKYKINSLWLVLGGMAIGLLAPFVVAQ
ncbi:chromate efflux transporter [Picosynechococcus sp. PCC 11901]|uniref:chromate efflux transporter n=1 Tax=Picosynechococcus sp. PCC 11901 TaxID=2579791 RepID=UPI0010FBCA8C|nr:chromate efflux transporter [Picosynechococcus sp. PCC 11901]QCS49889.1 chromate efflux transporter [Picosynechococcus sp. PCC 11901]